VRAVVADRASVRLSCALCVVDWRAAVGARSAWQRYWKGRIKDVILAEIRVDVTKVTDVDIDSDTFKCVALVYVRIPIKAIYNDWKDRLEDPGITYVSADGKKIEEFWPRVDVQGKSKVTMWVKEKEEMDKIVYCYEFELSGETLLKHTGAYYPFDYHQLGISIVRGLRFLSGTGGGFVF
jgi:hypothetical protein